MCTALVPLVVGWALGLASTLAVEWWRRRTQRTELKTLLSTEARSLRFRLVTMAEVLVSRFGEYDCAFVQWVMSNLQDYDDTEEEKRLRSHYQRLMSSTAAIDATESLRRPELSRL
jgi:hypothetical protein